MEVLDEALLERYSAMFPEGRPSSPEEVAHAQELAAQRKALLVEEAEARGIENVGTLQKQLDKELNKRLKKKDKKDKPKAKKTGADAPNKGGEQAPSAPSAEILTLRSTKRSLACSLGPAAHFSLMSGSAILSME